MRAGAALEAPGGVEQAAELGEVSRLVGEDALGHVDQRQHLLELGGLVRDAVGLLHVRGEAGEAGEEHHQIGVELALALGRDDDRADREVAVGEVDAVEAAEGRGDLVLPAAGLGAQLTLQPDGLPGQAVLGGVGALHAVEGVEHAHGEGRGGAKARAGGKVGLVGDAHLAHVEHLHGVAHGGVGDPLDPRVDELRGIIEEARQMARRDVAVLVERGRDDRAAVLVEELRHVRAAAEERHTEGCASDNHLFNPSK